MTYDNHEQIEVDYFGRTIEVDKGIADLLQLIWSHNIRTYMSCENVSEPHESETVWICFLSLRYCNSFLEIVAKYSEDYDSMYRRIMMEAHTSVLYPADKRVPWVVENDGGESNWQYSFFPINIGVDVEIKDNEAFETFSGVNDFEFRFSVRFKKTEIPEIMENLRLALEIENNETFGLNNSNSLDPFGWSGVGCV